MGIANTQSQGTLVSGAILQGRYTVDRELAIGDFSTVYLAHDLKSSDPASHVVLKQRPYSGMDIFVQEMLVRSFEREADILATVSHPSIPRIYDYFTEADQSYVVMEFIRGEDLRTLLGATEGFLLEEAVTPWAIDVCDALAYLHRHRPVPIVHRDVKPQHIVLDPSGRPYLVGFAIACAYQLGQKETAIGTTAYAAPEQFQGTATPQSDIYGLGATLYHVLTRQIPSPPPATSEAGSQIRKLNPGVSMSMQAIIGTALQPNPDDRFDTASDLKLALIGLGY